MKIKRENIKLPEGNIDADVEIYDIEDNILEKKSSNINKFTDLFKSNRKIHYLIKNSNHIIASSPFLSEFYCKNLSKYSTSTFISSSLNMSYRF